MALYVELDATASNGEQYWYDQYTEGEPRIAAVKSVATSVVKAALTGLRDSSVVVAADSTTITAWERLLQPVSAEIEANSTVINNGNYISSSGIVPFPSSETITAGIRALQPCAALQYGAVTVYVNGRKKWEEDLSDNESWNPILEASDTWTKFSESSTTWSASSEASNTWTKISESSITWTEEN